MGARHDHAVVIGAGIAGLLAAPQAPAATRKPPVRSDLASRSAVASNPVPLEKSSLHVKPRTGTR
ncbi:hypothetical protein SAMN05216215_1021102 [Saccharopolyspora shandongensis]|uniref:Uncharacterized protein n=1 Tax=Saccharopolyspora shandongensis TaxID=418495 RepID=A0A1H3HUH3_9PSEU|nr:hypothetical protein [Saccharopolyspora shandongensis]SDY19133.1 hypothetical protein SAMN05216215_1021102 [Saccharopolyspora shandongensis]